MRIAERDEHRRRCYKRAIDLLRAADAEDLADVTTHLVWELDSACQKRLVAGRTDLFGPVEALRLVFDAALADTNLLERIGIRPEEGADGIFRDALFQALLDKLRNEGEIFFVSDRQRARSRAFEIVHYLRNLTQRTHKNANSGIQPRLVEMVKVEVRKRERPERDQSIDDLVDRILDLDEVAADGVLASGAFDVVKRIADRSFKTFLVRAFGGGARFAEFQAESFKRLLERAFSSETDPPSTVIAAGTGFGKTEAFLFPILYYASCRMVSRAMRIASGESDRPGMDALLLYPRRDLCDNQAERLVGYLYHLNIALEQTWEEEEQADLGERQDIRVALAHAGDMTAFRIRCPACAASWKNRTPTPEEVRKASLVAVIENDFVTGFRCETDEIGHERAASLLNYQIRQNSKASNLAIATVDTLHRRLMDDHGRKLLFADRSVPPRFVVLDEMHIFEGQSGSHVAHILRRCRNRIRQMRSAQRLNPVLVGASATVGDPQDLARRLFGTKRVEVVQPGESERRAQGLEYFVFLQSPGNRFVEDDDRLQDPDERDGDADGIGPARRFVSEQATMIQAAFCLQHNMKAPEGAGPTKRRTLGFVDSVDVASRLAQNLHDAEWQDLCHPPSKRQPLYSYRHPLGRPGVDIMTTLQRAVQDYRRIPASVTFGVPGTDCPKAESRTCNQPPHHLLERCERYESGECWYAMAQPAEEGLRPLLIQHHRSGRRAWADPNRSFREADRDDWRLLISTSALEVGFDHPELIATWQYHAPPSIAAFVQRKGRGGRGVRDYPITMVVLGTSPTDIYRFQDHSRLVNYSAADVVSVLDELNPSVRDQHIVAAVFDYCAANRTFQSAFKLDLDAIQEALRSSGLLPWLVDCFPSTPQGQLAERLKAFAQTVTEVWNARLDFSAVPPELRPGPDMRPSQLFRLSRDQLIQLHTRMSDAGGSNIALAWLQQGLRAIDKDPRWGVRSVVDFCRYIPRELLSEPDLCVPDSTIPVPLGRYVRVLRRSDRGLLDLEPAEFALRCFLPGGFKIRYQGRLWMAPWVPVPDKPSDPASNRVWVSTRSQVVEAVDPDAASTVADELERSALSRSAREELLAILGEDCALVRTEGLLVEDLGTARPRSFSMHRVTRQLVARRPDDADPADYRRLARDPHVTPRFVVIRQRNENWKPFPVGGLRGLVDHRAHYYARYGLTVAHYANLVHCYPSSEEAETIVLRFWDEKRECPLAPAIRLSTQALEFRFRWDGTTLTKSQRGRVFWRKVEDQLLERCVVGEGILPSAYAVPATAEMLAMLEGATAQFCDAPPDRAWLEEHLEKFSVSSVIASKTRVARQWCLDHLQVIDSIIQTASTWVRTTGAAAVLGDSLAAGLARAAASTLNVSPTSFRTLVSHEQGDETHIVLFDDFEGGSGNVRRLAELWNSRFASGGEFGRVIADRCVCPAERTDRVLGAAFAGRASAETLTLLGNNRDAWPPDWSEGLSDEMASRALFRLRRLTETPELAAFNLYAFGEWSRLSEAREGSPVHLRFYDHVYQTPALDPRAEELRRRFIGEESDGVNELSARLREVMSLCEASCPECLGTERYERAQFSDRTVLQQWLKG